MFLYTNEPSPASEGFIFNTIPTEIEGTNYNKVISIYKDFNDDVNTYDVIFRIESDPCHLWSINIGMSILMDSLPKKPDEYHVNDPQCDKYAWTYMTLSTLKAYRVLNVDVYVGALLSTSNGMKIKAIISAGISEQGEAVTVGNYVYSYLPVPGNSVVKIKEGPTTGLQGEAYLVKLEPREGPNNSPYNQTIGFKNKKGQYDKFSYTIYKMKTITGGSKNSIAYGVGSTIGSADSFGPGEYECEIVVVEPS